MLPTGNLLSTDMAYRCLKRMTCKRDELEVKDCRGRKEMPQIVDRCTVLGLDLVALYGSI